MNTIENSLAPVAEPRKTTRQEAEETTTEDKIRKSGIKTPESVFEQYLQMDSKINEIGFSDVYGVEEIVSDRKRVEHIKNTKGFTEPTKEGIVLENMFCDLAEKHAWFGEGTKVVLLSEFDDKIASGAHCDAVLEVPTQGGVVRIGIDLTTSINYDNLSKKRTKCLEAVQKDKLFSVKYFKSKIDGTKGKIDNLPVFFAGVDKETLGALCASVAKQENTQSDGLKNHEVQLMFIKELVAQAETFYAVAFENHGEDANITKYMDYYQRLFDWMYDNKKSLAPNGFGQKASQDKVYEYITKFV